MNKLQTLESKLGKNRIKTGFPLSSITTYRVGGPAEYFFQAITTEELIKAIEIAKFLDLKLTLLGGGSNVLISDKGLKGLVIRNESNNITIYKRIGKINHGKLNTQEVILEVDAGVLMNRLVRYTCDNGLKGLEYHLGLPGSVGGAIYNNSKWTKPLTYIGDSLSEAILVNNEGKLKKVDINYFKFAYDFSILQKTHESIISIFFHLTQEDPKILWQRANDVMKYQQLTQPMGVKSAGCVFKNIYIADAMRIGTPNHTLSAGYLIDQTGLKNFSIGGAKFSDKHANFIINTNNAVASDIYALIKEAQERVFHKFKVKIEPEIMLLGEFN